MRLLHLHVENFGTLSNYDVDLQAGLNEALRENGWGKTAKHTKSPQHFWIQKKDT